MSDLELLSKFIRKFKGRLDSEVLRLALGYVDRGESAFALDTVLENLYEYEINLSRSEYDEAMFFISLIGALSMEYIYLKELIDENEDK